MFSRLSSIRWIVASLGAAATIALAYFFTYLIIAPGLGDGVHRIHPSSWLLLLPSVSYGLVSLFAFVLPARDRLGGAVGISLLLLLPAIYMAFLLRPVFGLIVAAVLALPLLDLWAILYRLATRRTTNSPTWGQRALAACHYRS